jgi:hypothetical protein
MTLDLSPACDVVEAAVDMPVPLTVTPEPPTTTFEVQRAADDPTRWVFTITQPAADATVDPVYRVTGDNAAAAIAVFCAQQLAGLGVLPQDAARMICDRIPLPPSEVA